MDALRVGMGISSVSTAHKDRGCGRAQASAVYNVATRLPRGNIFKGDYPVGRIQMIGPRLALRYSSKGLCGLWAMSNLLKSESVDMVSHPKVMPDLFSMQNMFLDMVT